MDPATQPRPDRVPASVAPSAPPAAPPALAPPPAEGREYRPRLEVVARPIHGLGLLALGGFALSVLMRLAERDWAYFHDVFPVHLMLAAFIGAYLPYLSYALFRSLSRGCSLRRHARGLVVGLEGRTHDLPWETIRQVRFGDLYLKLDTAAGRIEVPFIHRDDQREIYRWHQRAVGFHPEPGRFFAALVRNER